MELQLRQLQAEVLAKREPAVQRITQKNRLLMKIKHLDESLDSADEATRRQISEAREVLQDQLTAVEAEIAQLKAAVIEAQDKYQEAWLSFEAAGIPPHNRARAKELLLEKELVIRKLIENPPDPPDRYRQLNREMGLLMADIHDLRNQGKDKEADKLVERLDEVLAEIDIEQSKWHEQERHRRLEATAQIDQELQKLLED